MDDLDRAAIEADLEWIGEDPEYREFYDYCLDTFGLRDPLYKANIDLMPLVTPWARWEQNQN